MTNSIINVLSSINKSFGLNLTPTDLADIVWFAIKISENEQSNEVLHNGDVSKVACDIIQVSPLPLSSILVASKTPTIPEKKLRNIEEGSSSSRYTSTTSISTSTTLPESPSILRSFHPLKRKIFSKKDFVIDEEATTRKIASENLFLPVFKFLPRKWCDLVIMIDEAESMVVWQKAISEFTLSLKKLGVFRTIKAFLIKTDEDIAVYQKNFYGSSLRRKKFFLGDKSLVFLLSDCTSVGWRSGNMAKVIDFWGKRHSVVLVEMLPRLLWSITALDKAKFVKINTIERKPNDRLAYQAVGHEYETSVSNYYSPIPTITLDTQVISSFVKSFAGEKAGLVLGSRFPCVLDDSSCNDVEPYLSPKDIVEDFCATASPIARQLAVLLSPIPFDFDLIQLIQKTLLPQAKQFHLAEVFLSGLLVKIDTNTDQPSLVRYEYKPGVRELLLNLLRASELFAVFEVASQYVKTRFKQSFNFLDLIEFPDSISSLTVTSDSKPFIHAGTSVLKRLGNKYKSLVIKLEETIEELDKEKIQDSVVQYPEKTVFIKDDSLEIKSSLGNNLTTGSELESEGSKLLNMARYNEARQKYVEALNIYDQAIKENLYSELLYTNRGIALQNLGRLEAQLSDYHNALFYYEEAIKAHNAAIRINSSFAPAYNNKGLALQYLGDLEAIQTRYSHAQKSFNQSIEALDQAISLDTNLMPAYNNKGNSFSRLGHLLFQLSKYEEAETLYQKSLLSYDQAIILSPKRANLYSNKAVVLESIAKLKKELSDYDEALKVYDQAIGLTDHALSMEPNDISIYGNKALSLFNKGELFFWLGEYTEALNFCQKSLDVYEKALSIAPNYIEAHSNKSLVLKLLGDIYFHVSSLEKAREYYELSLNTYGVVLQLSPNDMESQSNKADILFKEAQVHVALSNYEKAIECFLESIKVYDTALPFLPNSLGLLSGKGLSLKELGNLYSTLSRFEDAKINLNTSIETFSFALQISENLILLYNNLGLAFHSFAELRSNLAEYKEAVQIYEKAINSYDRGLQLAPNFVPVLYNKAITLIRKGELEAELSEHNEALRTYDSAIDFCDKALKIAPKCLPALNNKAVALSVKGYLQKQLRLFNESLDNYHLASKIIDDVVSVTPTASDIYSNKGNGLASIAELYDFLDNQDLAIDYYEKSINAFDKSLTFQNNNVSALSGKAAALSKYGFLRGELKQYSEGKSKFEDAIQTIDRAIELAPKDPRFHYNKGRILIDFGDFHKLFFNLLGTLYNYEEAIKCYDKDLQIAPNSIRALNNKAHTMQKIVEVVFLLINSPQISSLINDLLLKGENYCTQAANIYDQILASNPANLLVLRNKLFILFYLAQIKVFRKKRQEAIGIYKYCLPIIDSILKTIQDDEQLRKLRNDVLYLLGQLEGKR